MRSRRGGLPRLLRLATSKAKNAWHTSRSSIDVRTGSRGSGLAEEPQVGSGSKGIVETGQVWEDHLKPAAIDAEPIREDRAVLLN